MIQKMRFFFCILSSIPRNDSEDRFLHPFRLHTVKDANNRHTIY